MGREESYQIDESYQNANLMDGPANLFMFNDGISLFWIEPSPEDSSEGKK